MVGLGVRCPSTRPGYLRSIIPNPSVERLRFINHLPQLPVTPSTAAIPHPAADVESRCRRPAACDTPSARCTCTRPRLFVLALCALAGIWRSTGRWRGGSRGNGRRSSARRLGCTCCGGRRLERSWGSNSKCRLNANEQEGRNDSGPANKSQTDVCDFKQSEEKRTGSRGRKEASELCQTRAFIHHSSRPNNDRRQRGHIMNTVQKRESLRQQRKGCACLAAATLNPARRCCLRMHTMLESGI